MMEKTPIMGCVKYILYFTTLTLVKTFNIAICKNILLTLKSKNEQLFAHLITRNDSYI